MKKIPYRVKRIEGNIYNNVKVIEYYDSKPHARWVCECHCGKTFITYGNYLKRGNTKSCGCYKENNPSNFRHGMSKTRFWNIWRSMKQRCLYPKYKDFKYYGGKGINICESWKRFDNFKEDMYESYTQHVADYGEKDTTIDRIDSNGNYCKENCKWSTLKEQANNKSNNVIKEEIN